jgi:acyl-CoA reductase-like NAD-dependent aldehyde dehydrogenase
VVGLITPWNFPAAIPTWKTAPALAYGNTVVLKLAQYSPLTGLHIARTATRCVDELQAGIIHVNSQTAGAEVHVPFGGIKSSRLWPARAGPVGDRLLHARGHGLPGCLTRMD